MEDTILLEKLMLFGLTRQEGILYLNILKHGAMSGYECAKQTGISRSNAYNGLAGLVEKGAAYVIEGVANKYIAVEVEEFCTNKIQSMQKEKEYLAEHIKVNQHTEDGYITITGYRHVMDKILTMLREAKERVYIAASAEFLEKLTEPLQEVLEDGRKLVIITDKMIGQKSTDFYLTSTRGTHLRLIIDSSYVLTGDITGSSLDTVLYSGQKNFVNVFKEAMSNEIKLIQITKGEKEYEENTVCNERED